MLNENNEIWMNGEFVPAERAVVPFLNNTLHYGIGFFEGLRAYCFRMSTRIKAIT